MSVSKWFLLTVAGMLAWSASAAQVRTTGEIRGTVVDPSGSLVPGVAITAKDLGTNITHAVTSGPNGTYVLLNLQPGSYEVTGKAEGFQTTVVSNVVVETARTLDLNIQLKVGQIAQTLEVRDVAPLLQTTTNTVATTIRNDFIQDLPLAGRDTLQFAALMAGPGHPARAPATARSTDCLTPPCRSPSTASTTTRSASRPAAPASSPSRQSGWTRLRK
jgi:hypothetical protein